MATSALRTRQRDDGGATGLLILSSVILLFALAAVFYPSFKRGRTIDPKSMGNMTPVEAVRLGDVVVDATTGKTEIEVSTEEKTDEKDKVVRQRSQLDREFYFVSASLSEKQKAADRLAEVHRRSQHLMQALDDMLEEERFIEASDGVDITSNIKRLLERHYKKRIPFAEYHNPHDNTVGSNSAKGTLIEMCLRSKYDPNEWNPINTIFRVHVHELTHSADKKYREDGDHGVVFNRIMNFLLQTAGNLGIYSCEEYKKSGRKYCGLTLTEEDHECSG